MASEVSIGCSSPEGTWSRFWIKWLPVCVRVADVPFDINHLRLWICPFEINIVHPQPSFARWFCNDFKSFGFLQPPTLQRVRTPSFGNLDRTDNLIQEWKLTVCFPYFFVASTHSSLCSSIWKEVRFFQPTDSLCPCLLGGSCCNELLRQSRSEWWGSLGKKERDTWTKTDFPLSIK